MLLELTATRKYQSQMCRRSRQWSWNYQRRLASCGDASSAARPQHLQSAMSWAPTLSHTLTVWHIPAHIVPKQVRTEVLWEDTCTETTKQYQIRIFSPRYSGIQMLQSYRNWMNLRKKWISYLIFFNKFLDRNYVFVYYIILILHLLVIFQWYNLNLLCMYYTSSLVTQSTLKSQDHMHITLWTILYMFSKESFALKCRDNPRRNFADLVLGAQV